MFRSFRENDIQSIAYFAYLSAPGELCQLIAAAVSGKRAATFPLIRIEHAMGSQKVMLALIGHLYILLLFSAYNLS